MVDTVKRTSTDKSEETFESEKAQTSVLLNIFTSLNIFKQTVSTKT